MATHLGRSYWLTRWDAQEEDSEAHRRADANFNWGAIPLEANEEEEGDLYLSWLLIEAAEFNQTVAVIQNRIRAVQSEERQQRAKDRATQYEHNRRPKNQYIPILRDPEDVRNCTELIILGLLIRLGRNDEAAAFAWHSTMRDNTGTTEHELTAALRHFKKHQWIWPLDGKGNSSHPTRLYVNAALLAHYQLPVWLARRFEVSPVTKVGYSTVKYMAMVQHTNRKIKQNRNQFRAIGADVAAKMPLPTAERTGRQILKDLTSHQLILPDDFDRHVYHLNLDHEWRYSYRPLAGGYKKPPPDSSWKNHA